jgi:CDP-6-deoxy-D-xylo-4-hexulose-3-dehydrase
MPEDGTPATRKDIEDRIYSLIDLYYSYNDYSFVPGKTKIPLQRPPISSNEVKSSLQSLLSTWVTMGEKVKAFEGMFTKYIGTKYGTMVNSGSSANLLALSILMNPRMRWKMNPGDEVITPAVTWSTTVYPIFQNSLKPVLVDVDLETFDINVDAMEKAITEKTRAIMPVHLLGNPADMKRIMEIAEDKDLYVIEDSCEAHGAEVGGKKVGSMGDIGTFSFFVSHHITTIEGGMVMTNNEDINELAKSMRVFGWIRDLKNKDDIAAQNKGIDPRFLFHNYGYNFRPTEINGAFGVSQMPRLEDYIKIRQENANFWNKVLEPYSQFIMTHKERFGTRHTWFSYPMTVRKGAPFTRKDIMSFLETRMIETRPIQAGDMTQQPCMSLVDYRVSGYLENSKFIHDNSFFIGNHQGIGKDEREYVAQALVDFLGKVRPR